MKLKVRDIIIYLGIGGVFIAVPTLFMRCVPNATVIIQNESRDVISGGLIRAGAGDVVVPQLEPGQSKAIRFHATPGSYDVFMTFENGRSLTALGKGYTTTGFNYSDRISVFTNKIEVIQSRQFNGGL